jgi:hypothetical protein
MTLKPYVARPATIPTPPNSNIQLGIVVLAIIAPF